MNDKQNNEIVSDGSSIFVFHKHKGDYFVTTESSFKALSNMHLINSTFLSFPSHLLGNSVLRLLEPLSQPEHCKTTRYRYFIYIKGKFIVQIKKTG